MDDSLFIRSMVKRALESLELVGDVLTVPNGEAGLEVLREQRPDLVILDLQMPRKNGFEVLETMNGWENMPPTIVFSGTEERGAAGAIRALEMGAAEFVPKSNEGGTVVELLSRVAPFLEKVTGGEVSSVKQAAAPVAPALDELDRIELVVVGASTGGPNALIELGKQLPASLEVPVLIVLHMPPVFTKQFAARMDRSCPLRVREGVDGAELKAGDVWVAPGGHHMVVGGTAARPRLVIHDAAPENSCRPSVDPLFRSAAELYGPNSLAVMMTGMGSDGFEGSKAIHRGGGRILVQDQATCVVWGMPRFVEEGGLASAVLPLQALGPTIGRWVQRSRGSRAPKERTNQRQAIVIDDSRAIRSMTRRILEGAGLGVHEAADGAEALERLASLPTCPEVALVDWNMPVMDGIEFIQHLRADPRFSDLLTIMVSSESEAQRMAYALEVGADEYMMKPFSREDLLSRLFGMGIVSGDVQL